MQILTLRVREGAIESDSGTGERSSRLRGQQTCGGTDRAGKANKSAGI